MTEFSYAGWLGFTSGAVKTLTADIHAALSAAKKGDHGLVIAILADAAHTGDDALKAIAEARRERDADITRCLVATFGPKAEPAPSLDCMA